MNKNILVADVPIMSEDEIKMYFVKELSALTHEVFGILEEMNARENIPNRELCIGLQKEIDKLETFLDDYGASNNKTFFYFRELVACVRWMNLAMSQAIHIEIRFENYSLELLYKEKKEFLRRLKQSLVFYFECVRICGEQLIKEADKLGLRKKKIKISITAGTSKIIQKKMLPHDLDEDVVQNENERVRGVVLNFLEVCEKFRIFAAEIQSNKAFVEQDSCSSYVRGYSQTEMPSNRVATEQVLERFRSWFNQIQSTYDTYVSNTHIEYSIADLKKVRGHIAVILHLLEIGKSLVHLQERHIDKIRDYPVGSRIAELISETKVKNNLRNFVIGSSVIFAVKSKELSRSIFRMMGSDPDEFIIDTNVLMIPSYRIEDFHLRPIMPITRIAAKYQTGSFLYFNRNRYDIKSPIEMAIAIPDIREVLLKEDAKIRIQGPRKSVCEMTVFLQEKCGAYEIRIVPEGNGATG